jgi:hypothetical protein
LPAKLVGINASTAFIFLTIFSAALSALFIFWLLVSVTGDNLLSAAGVFAVCCLGAAVAYQGELRAWADGNILVDYMPFLRRYQPGFAFPLFFLFCALVWRSLNAAGRRSSVLYSTLSGVVFGLLVFSYFYLWTAAAAWLAIVYGLNFVWNRDARANLWRHAAIVGTFAAATLIPYFSFIADRSPNIDAIQLLATTHMPDLKSPSMVFGLLVLFAVVVLALLGRIDMRSPRTLFTLAFASMPVLLFNQQIVTGRSLQPVHYELFIANYVVLVSFVLLCSMLIRPVVIGTGFVRKFALVMAAALAVVWGGFESYGSAVRNTAFADLRDTSIPAIKYIDSLEQRNTRPGSAVVLATNTGTSDMIPTIASLRPLWSSHSSSVGGLGVAENKRLFHHYLVLAGFREHDVAEALHGGAFEMTAAFFGSERALPSLGQGGEPITSEEIEEEVDRFAQFRTNFSREAASDPELSYVIVTDGSEPDLTVLDRWYERDEGTVTGPLKVYNVTLRP